MRRFAGGIFGDRILNPNNLLYPWALCTAGKLAHIQYSPAMMADNSPVPPNIAFLFQTALCMNHPKLMSVWVLVALAL